MEYLIQQLHLRFLLKLANHPYSPDAQKQVGLFVQPAQIPQGIDTFYAILLF